MDLTKIMERLSSFPEHGICVYNGDGQLERKTYPHVKANINNAINQLCAWGVQPSMHVGILSTNWYEFINLDMALTAYIDAENPADTRVRQVARENNNEEYTPAIAFSSGSSGKIKGMTINPQCVEELFAGLKDYKPTLCLAPHFLYEGIHAQFMRAVNGMPVRL